MRTTTEFIGSIGKLQEAPQHAIPEIAFVGRSNVGKSSLLTMLTGLRKLAPVSKTPGRTRRIGFYNVVEQNVCLVDLPGYGFARLGAAYKKKLGLLMQQYILTRNNLKGVVLLVDARRASLSADDLDMIDLIAKAKQPLLLVMTKSDKLGKNKIHPAQHNIEASIGLPKDAVLPVSSQTGLGKQALWSELLAMIA